MTCAVTLRFPFLIDGREHVSVLEVPLIRKENTVSFSIPFSALVTVDTEKMYTVHYTVLANNKCGTGVCIDFKSINDAILFSSAPEVYISYVSPTKLAPIEEELQRVTDQMERTKEASAKRRKKSCRTDREGYSYYV